MNNSFPRLIDGMCATLRSEVLSRLDDEFARGQVFGIINLLNTFKVRADWSVGFLSEQVNAQCDAINQARELLAGISDAPEFAERFPISPISSIEISAMRDDGNRIIGQMMEWLSLQRDCLPRELLNDIEQPLRQSMRKEIEIELKNSPRPLFAEMSSGKEDSPPTT
jgi:hypothetical protein